MASEVSVYALYVYALFPLTQMLQQKNKSRAQCPIFNIGMARDFLQIARTLGLVEMFPLSIRYFDLLQRKLLRKLHSVSATAQNVQIFSNFG